MQPDHPDMGSNSGWTAAMAANPHRVWGFGGSRGGLALAIALGSRLFSVASLFRVRLQQPFRFHRAVSGS